MMTEPQRLETDGEEVWVSETPLGDGKMTVEYRTGISYINPDAKVKVGYDYTNTPMGDLTTWREDMARMANEIEGMMTDEEFIAYRMEQEAWERAIWEEMEREDELIEEAQRYIQG